MQVRKKKLELDIEQNRLVPNGERSTSRLYIVTLLISLIHREHHEKRRAGWSTSWDQDCGRNINNLRYADILLTESEDELQRRQWHPTPVLLPGKSHEWRSLVGCSPCGHKESNTTERLQFHFSLSCIGGGNGNPLQCSCLENPRDRGAGRLPSMGLHRVRHDWSDWAAAEEELKSLLMKVKEEWKNWLKAQYSEN